MLKRALITGITGQDGSYLTELLLGKGYEVHGIIRRASTFNTDRIDHIYEDPHGENRHLYLHYGDLSTGEQLINLIYNMQPDEIYHLGAQSHVRVSFDVPEFTGNITGMGTTRILEAVRSSGIHCRFYQAGSSEMFGSTPPPQSESTPFHPRSPYGAAKVYGHWMTVNYREAYGMFAANGILFNHESPRRGETFVTRKITRAVARIQAGRQAKLYLGNSMPTATGAMLPNMSRACGASCNRRRHPTTYWEQANPTPCVSLWTKLSATSIWIGESMSNSIHAIYVPRKSSSCWRMPAKRSSELDWEPSIKFKELVRIMVDARYGGDRSGAEGRGPQILQEKFGEWHQWADAVSKSLEAAAGTPWAIRVRSTQDFLPSLRAI